MEIELQESDHYLWINLKAESVEDAAKILRVVGNVKIPVVGNAYYSLEQINGCLSIPVRKEKRTSISNR